MKLGSLFAPKEAPSFSAIRTARIAAARRNASWTEIQESELVPRGRLLVDADSDAVFTGYRGTVWMTGQASIASSDFAPLYFFVAQDGDLVFLERQRQTWSEMYARKCRR